MTTVATNTLPLATTPAFTPRGVAGPAEGWHIAWTRASAEAIPRGAAERPAVLPQVHAATRAALHAAALPGSAPAMRVAAGARAPAPVVVQPNSHPLGPRIGARAIGTPMDAAEGDIPLRGARRPQDPPPAPQGRTLRVYLEQHPDGLALWFGMNVPGASRSDRTAGLVNDLRRLWPGLPIVSVVCNGQVLYTRQPSPKETS